MPDIILMYNFIIPYQQWWLPQISGEGHGIVQERKGSLATYMNNGSEKVAPKLRDIWFRLCKILLMNFGAKVDLKDFCDCPQSIPSNAWATYSNLLASSQEKCD
jgi:hypothetical protein